MNTIEFNYSKTLKEMPGSYSELPFKKYLNIYNKFGPDGLENQLMVLEELTGVKREVLECIPYDRGGYGMIELIRKSKFLFEEYKPKKSNLKLKKYDELTYDIMLFIGRSEDAIKDLPKLISLMSIDKLTEDEVLELPASDVYDGFFLFRKDMKKLLLSGINSTLWKMLKLQMKQKMGFQSEKKDKK